MTAQKPTMPEVLTRALATLKVGIRTVVPANVVTYDPVTQSAAVQPAPRVRNGAGELVLLPQVANAPVWYPQGGGWSITWPLLPGDPVLLLVADRHLDRFRITGTAYDPDAIRLHDLTDAVVLPGAGPAPDPATGISAVDLTISGPGGIAMRVSPAGVVSLGGTEVATQPLAIAELLHSYLTAMIASGLPVANDGGAALQTAWSTYLASNPPDAFAATRVQGI